MSSTTIRKLDQRVKERPRVRGAQNGRSMEAERRHILQTVLAAPEARGRSLYDRIRERFAPLGGVDLELPEREPPHFE